MNNEITLSYDDINIDFGIQFAEWNNHGVQIRVSLISLIIGLPASIISFILIIRLRANSKSEEELEEVRAVREWVQLDLEKSKGITSSTKNANVGGGNNNPQLGIEETWMLSAPEWDVLMTSLESMCHQHHQQTTEEEQDEDQDGNQDQEEEKHEDYSSCMWKTKHCLSFLQEYHRHQLNVQKEASSASLAPKESSSSIPQFPPLLRLLISQSDEGNKIMVFSKG